MTTRAITAATVRETVADNDIVLLDFWAAWCGLCRSFAPVFEQASKDHADIVFGKVETEAERELAASFGITSIPTLIAFREGVVMFSQPGALAAPQLDQLVTKLRDLDMADVHAQVAAQQAGVAR